MYSKALLAGVASATLAGAPAHAELLLRNLFQDAALSVDGWGDTASQGQLQANVPSGSQVLRAYLYTPSIWNFVPVFPVTFGGQSFQLSDGIQLTPNNNPATTMLYDVTSIVKPVIEGGTGGIYNFTINDGGGNDGAVLVVAYSNAETQGRSALVLDGELATGGDTTLVNFAAPFTSGDFIMSLGISFSRAFSFQTTEIDITTSSNPLARRLASCAGGNNDGFGQNGALITAGGVGDLPGNPDPNCEFNEDFDDELYNLSVGNTVNPAPFLTFGDTWLRLNTINPSNDDNVFGMFITSGVRIANVDGPSIGVPEPGTMAIMGSALLGIGVMRRRAKHTTGQQPGA